MTEQIQAIDTSKCVLHPLNRKRLGDMKAFTQDVAENGIEVPLIGRQLTTEQTRASYPDHDNGSQAVQILAGARRLTAADGLFLTVPVILREYEDHEAFRFMMRENLHREDVHPIDESDYFAQCITESNGMVTVELIAAEIAMSESYVHKRLALQQLVPKARRMFLDGTLNAAVAMEFARLPEDVQGELVSHAKEQLRYNTDPITSPMVRRWIERDHLFKLAGAEFNTDCCAECEHRTGAVPSLFGDLSTEDICTNGKCYKAKAARHLKEQTEKLNADKDVPWRPIASSHFDARKKYEGMEPLQNWQWKGCAKTDENAVRGLMIGPDPHDMGRVLWIRIEKFSHYEKTPQEKAAAARGRRNERVTSHHRRLVFQELRQQPVKASELDLRDVALAFFKRLGHDTEKIVCREWGWDPIKQQSYNGWDYEKTCAERLKVMKDAEVRQFLATLPVAHVIHHNYWGQDKDRLMDVATAAGVDVKKLKQESEEKFPLKKAKKKKAKKGGKK